jgi:hypothetical protein
MNEIVVYIALAIVVAKLVFLAIYLIYRFCCLKRSEISPDVNVGYIQTTIPPGPQQQQLQGYYSWQPAATTANTTTSSWTAVSTAKSSGHQQDQPYALRIDLPPSYDATNYSSPAFKTQNS